MSAAVSTPQAASAIASAASTYQVPAQLLAGVYGRESTFGTAYSPGQKTFGYFGLTSPGLWNPSFTFQQDADTAAKTLSTLFKEKGSWDAATLAYSGGSYNANEAEGTASRNVSLLSSLATAIVSLPTGAKTPPDAKGPTTGIAGTLDKSVTDAGNTVSTAASSADAVAGFLGDLTKPATWLRILKIVGGVVLIIMGLRELANAGGANIPSPLSAARAVA